MGKKTVRLTICALFMAINVILSSSIFSVAVPGGHVYLNDVIIVLASILLNPFEAAIVGGVGAFLGDLFFYPTPMFVSLVVRAIQSFVISWFSHNVLKEKPVAGATIGVALGVIIMVAGYSLGRAFIYSTPEYALLKLPYQIGQAVVGAVLGEILCFVTGIKKLFDRTVNGNTPVTST